MTKTALKVVEKDNTEQQINELKALQHEIKVLKAKEDKLKKTLINGYFSTNDTFIGSEGIVLATYKTYKVNQFVSSELKKDKPDLYNEYCIEVERARFELKK